MLVTPILFPTLVPSMLLFSVTDKLTLNRKNALVHKLLEGTLTVPWERANMDDCYTTLEANGWITVVSEPKFLGILGRLGEIHREKTWKVEVAFHHVYPVGHPMHSPSNKGARLWRDVTESTMGTTQIIDSVAQLEEINWTKVKANRGRT